MRNISNCIFLSLQRLYPFILISYQSPKKSQKKLLNETSEKLLEEYQKKFMEKQRMFVAFSGGASEGISGKIPDEMSGWKNHIEEFP